MPIYEYKCPEGHVTESTVARQNVICCSPHEQGGTCVALAKRIYSFGVGSVSGAGNTPSRTS